MKSKRKEFVQWYVNWNRAAAEHNFKYLSEFAKPRAFIMDGRVYLTIIGDPKKISDATQRSHVFWMMEESEEITKDFAPLLKAVRKRK